MSWLLSSILKKLRGGRVEAYNSFQDHSSLDNEDATTTLGVSKWLSSRFSLLQHKYIKPNKTAKDVYPC